MNIMGMGMFEVAVVFLVAFLVLGPSRTIDLARKSGKMLGELRRSFTDVTGALTIEEREHAEAPPPGVPVRPDVPDDDTTAGASPESGAEAEASGPPSSSGPSGEAKG